MRKHTEEKLTFQGMNFVFDRYQEYSIKGSNQENGAQNLDKHHDFCIIITTATKRSEPLILYLLQKATDLVSAFMCKKIADLQVCNLLFITGYLDSPIAVHDGLMI